MNSVINLLEKELLARQKVLHNLEAHPSNRKMPLFLLNEIAELKEALKLLRQQKVSKRKYAVM